MGKSVKSKDKHNIILDESEFGLLKELIESAIVECTISKKHYISKGKTEDSSVIMKLDKNLEEIKTLKNKITKET